MKFKFKELVENEIEIDLPAYTKDICHYYKVISENDIIQVCKSSHNRSIQDSTLGCAFMKGYEISNEKEFNNAFEQVLKTLRR